MERALSSEGISPSIRPFERDAFTWLVIYYWGMQYSLASGGSVERGGILYLLYIVPAAAFVMLVSAASPFRARFEGPTAWIGAFLAVVITVSIARGDVRTILSVGLFSGMVWVVLAFRLELSTALLNRFFIASIVGGIIAFALGHSAYFVLPGFGTDESIVWRVSVFPFVAPSAFFALLVVLTNLTRSDDALRWPMIALGAYFVIFSGLRSAWLALAFALTYLALIRLGRLRTTRWRLAFLVGTAVAFVGLLLAEQLAVVLSAIGGDFLNTFVFRATDGFQTPEEAAQAIFRGYIWSEHLRLAASSPLVGIGTFDFAAVATFDPAFVDRSSGSEAFLTGLFARVGLATLLLVVGLLVAIARAVRSERHLALAIGIVLAVAMLAYGSFLNAYDFVFLCILSVLAAPGGRNDPGKVGAEIADGELVR